MFLIQAFSETGPDASLAGLLWAAMGLFFLMAAVGWVASRGK